ncbi:transposase [Betaproteobacteria bacterium]|nr:transposase [Betaproteobacteria bacterium]
MSRLSGVSRTTIRTGLIELEGGEAIDVSRVRKTGGGRHCVEDNIPNLQEKIHEIVDASTYGTPEKVLSWTTESLRKIQGTLLKEYRIKVSFKTVGTVLEDMGYSKQTNQKMLQVGEAHPDRNAQFEFINNKAKQFIEAGEPVVSVDTKKKENLGNFKNNGAEYRRSKDPRKVLDHDFPIAELGKIAPYGVYNLNHNTGFVNIGISHDTAEFAVESLSRWWETLGKHTFQKAKKLLITCDCGGSNGNRLRLWKHQLAQLAERIGLEIHVSHFPPGTSKWNKIEHKLFCFISKNWQGKPLIDIKTAVNLIGSTTTTTGLKVICQTDSTQYELSKKVTDEQFNVLPIIKIAPFESWNYMLIKK